MENKICNTFVYATCIFVHKPESCVAHVERSGSKMDGGED